MVPSGGRGRGAELMRAVCWGQPWKLPAINARRLAPRPWPSAERRVELVARRTESHVGRARQNGRPHCHVFVVAGIGKLAARRTRRGSGSPGGLMRDSFTEAQLRCSAGTPISLVTELRTAGDVSILRATEEAEGEQRAPP